MKKFFILLTFLLSLSSCASYYKGYISTSPIVRDHNNGIHVDFVNDSTVIYITKDTCYTVRIK